MKWISVCNSRWQDILVWSNTTELIAHVSDMCIDKLMLSSVLQECTTACYILYFVGKRIFSQGYS